MLTQSLTFCSLFTILLAIIASLLHLYYKGAEKSELLLGVCVLSARDHTEQRSAIRHTWLPAPNTPHAAPNSTLVKFVVGREACALHPEDRLDPYGCQEWSPRLMPDMTADFEAFHTEASLAAGPQAGRLGVRVVHPVVLKRVGLLASVPLSGDPLVVSVFKDVEEEEFLLARFSLKDAGVIHRGFRYQQVEPALLPKGTQLEMTLNSLSDADVAQSSAVMSSSSDSFAEVWHNVRQQPGPGVLVVEGLREDGTVMKGHNSSLASVLSFMYSVHDVPALQRHTEEREQRRRQWRARVQAETEALEVEAAQYGDVLLVKGVVDTYRSLPSKLLRCHEWFWQNHAARHVMKTDDDTYVDLPAVTRALTTRPLRGLEWWGNFRREWGVERAGKWREEDYPPSLYPPFACGSGSVLSRDLHRWLSRGGRTLHPFQGEDVSLAIWLSPLAPSLLHDWRWQCFSLCHHAMLAMPDLSPHQIHTRWNQRQLCGSPCTSEC